MIGANEGRRVNEKDEEKLVRAESTRDTEASSLFNPRGLVIKTFCLIQGELP